MSPPSTMASTSGRTARSRSSRSTTSMRMGRSSRATQDARGVEPRGTTVALDAAQHRGPGHATLAQQRDDGLVERLAIVAVGFADVDARQQRGSVDPHGRSLPTRQPGNDGQHADDDRADEVAEHEQVVTLLDQAPRLQHQRRERGVGADEADHQRHADLRRHDGAVHGQGEDDAEHERAGDVDRERAPRKAAAGEILAPIPG